MRGMGKGEDQSWKRVILTNGQRGHEESTHINI